MRRAAITLVLVLLVANLAVSITLRSALAAEASRGRVDTPLWMVSTRGQSVCPPDTIDVDRFVYRRLDDVGCWRPSSADDFFAGNLADGVTCIVVAGSPASASDMSTKGRTVLLRVAARLPDDQPVRLVLWSWPADRLRGRLVNHFRVRALHAEWQAYYLAEFRRHLAPTEDVSLIGFSLGARSVAATLHLLADGRLGDRAIEPVGHDASGGSGHTRAALIAGAIDADWLSSHGRFSRALAGADAILTLYNSRDPLLKRYHRLYGRRGPAALGYSGVRGIPHDTATADKYRQLNVSGTVGRSHDVMRYVGSPWILDEVITTLFAVDAPLTAH